MLTSRRGRLVGLAILCGALVALAAGFGALAPDPSLNALPSEDRLGVDYDASVGARAQVSGTVVATDPVVLAAEYDTWTGDRYESGTVRLTVTGRVPPVAVGERLQVVGTVRPDRTIVATDAIAVPATNFRSMYVLSFGAGCWVLVRLLRGWTVDRTALAVRRRRESIDLRTRLRSAIRSEEDPADA